MESLHVRLQPSALTLLATCKLDGNKINDAAELEAMQLEGCSMIASDHGCLSTMPAHPSQQSHRATSSRELDKRASAHVQTCCREALAQTSSIEATKQTRSLYHRQLQVQMPMVLTL